jgi:hypothetical protein
MGIGVIQLLGQEGGFSFLRFEINRQITILDGRMSGNILDVMPRHRINGADAVIRFMQSVALSLVAR